VVEWLQIKGSDIPRVEISVDEYRPWFDVLDVRFNELDHHYCRIELRARTPGTRVGKKLFGNLSVTIRGSGEPLLNEVKKRGVMYDKERGKVELRVGDILMVYLTKKFVDDETFFSTNRSQT